MYGARAVRLQPEAPHDIHDVMAISLYDITRDKTLFGGCVAANIHMTPPTEVRLPEFQISRPTRSLPRCSQKLMVERVSEMVRSRSTSQHTP